MNSVNIMMGWKGKDAAALKQFFSDELKKNGGKSGAFILMLRLEKK